MPLSKFHGLLLFIIFLLYLFVKDEKNYFANYADVTTPYFVGNIASEISENLPCLTKKDVFSVCKQSNDSKAKYRVR